MEHKVQKGKVMNWVTDHPAMAVGIAVIIAFLPLGVVSLLSLSQPSWNLKKRDAARKDLKNLVTRIPV